MADLQPELSLDLLRVFEAAARHLSFTAAAVELGTTQPAVSQQIQRLEKQLATRLFDRVYRGIELTDSGRLLFVHVQDGLRAINLGLEAVGARAQHEVLQVATDFAIAAYWLMPRLHRFHEAHPEIDVSLVTSDRTMNMLRSEIDVAIAFGDGRFKHGDALLLFREEVFPICSPRLLKDQAAPCPPPPSPSCRCCTSSPRCAPAGSTGRRCSASWASTGRRPPARCVSTTTPCWCRPPSPARAWPSAGATWWTTSSSRACWHG